jgi:hypothetical protein
MARTRPPKAFAGAALDLATIAAGERFGHIYHKRYPDPLGFGKTKSRFSDPRHRVPSHRFGVLYLGGSLKVCFVEAMLRDQRNGRVGDYPIAETELRDRFFVEIEIVVPLSVVDLRGDGPLRMGVPSDVIGGSRQGLARIWSIAFYDHLARPDGIVYPSRLNGETNLAVYDRAVTKLRAHRPLPLIDAVGFAAVLDDLKVAVI